MATCLTNHSCTHRTTLTFERDRTSSFCTYGTAAPCVHPRTQMNPHSRARANHTVHHVSSSQERHLQPTVSLASFIISNPQSSCQPCTTPWNRKSAWPPQNHIIQPCIATAHLSSTGLEPLLTLCTEPRAQQDHLNSYHPTAHHHCDSCGYKSGLESSLNTPEHYNSLLRHTCSGPFHSFGRGCSVAFPGHQLEHGG